MRWLALAALAVVGGCVTAGSAPGDPPDPQRISYETGRCLGACPVYRVTVSADGEGLFEGKRFTAVQGQRAFRVTPDQYRAFASALAPLRPASGSVRYNGPPLCKRLATDLPSVTVTWRGSDGAEQSLFYYYGCDMQETRAMADRLRKAPSQLPIAAYVRRTPPQ